MKTKDLTKIALFVAVLTVSAYITVPFVIPFTMQTFAVFLACFMLGGVKAFVAILVYVLLGAIGLPVFPGFKGGAGALLGPTGGYIVGFLFSALVYGAITTVFGEKFVVKSLRRLRVLRCCMRSVRFGSRSDIPRAERAV